MPTQIKGVVNKTSWHGVSPGVTMEGLRGPCPKSVALRAKPLGSHTVPLAPYDGKNNLGVSLMPFYEYFRNVYSVLE